jgi:hypothetical protein
MGFRNIHICAAGEAPVPYVKWELYDLIAVYDAKDQSYNLLRISFPLGRGQYRAGDNINAYSLAQIVRKAVETP